MNDSEMLKVFMSALEKACKLMRDNPPCDITSYPPGFVNCVVGGLYRDPEGEEFVLYFLNQALEEYFESKESS